jgi:hypothetical protein
MQFKPGNGGKPKGAISTLTRRARELSEKLNIDPIEVLLYFAAGDWKALGYRDQYEVKGSDKSGGHIFSLTIDPNTRCRAAAEAAQYIYPKLKSVENTTNNALADMTPDQRLEAMKHGVAMLEYEIQLQKKKNKINDEQE